jgi:hypothetical protein
MFTEWMAMAYETLTAKDLEHRNQTILDDKWIVIQSTKGLLSDQI